MEFGLISDVQKRQAHCVVCNLLARHIQELEYEPGSTYRIQGAQYGGTKSKSHSTRRTDRMQYDLIPEVAVSGPSLPHIEEASSNRFKVLLELQECSHPIPKTSDFSTKRENNVQTAPNSEFSGRLMNEVQVDLGLFAYWIEHCERLHGEKCTESLWPATVPRNLISLLVIDVKKMCIVEAPKDCAYIALSYCWGRAKTLKHVVGNSKQLRKDGALSGAKIPNTIRDAITLVNGVGESYLWVDALCIIQDDDAARNVQLAQMGLIYSLAKFVIVAASGKDVDAGLPGIRPHTRNVSQEVLEIGGKTLITVIDGPYYGGVGKSQWITRGWTLQEKVLSKRALIFTDQQVYWRCWGATWLEETVLEDVTNPTFLRTPALTDAADIDFSIALRDYYYLYQMLVSNFIRRQLSFDSDIVNAFDGIAQALCAINNDTFHWGLPESGFRFALSWRLTGPARRNKALCPVFLKDTSVIGVPYPSWSWTAWYGNSTKNWMFCSGTALSQHDIVVYRQAADGKLRMIKDDGSVQEDAIVHAKHEEAAPALDLKTQWLSNPKTIVEGSKPPSGSNLDEGHLHFWTSTAELYVHRRGYDYESGPSCILVLPREDGEGFEDSSLVFFDSPMEIPFRDPNVIAKTPQSVLDHVTTKDNEEFNEDCDVLIKEFIIIGRMQEGSLASLSALVVEWENGVAYRIGTANIYEGIWARLKNREWKRVILG
jgi:hypothetical protein